MKKYLFGLVILGSIIVAPAAYANPLFFPASTGSSAATTTVNFMTPGIGTTTVSIDSYAAGSNKATDKAALLLQTNASSTSSIYNVSIQYSQDGIDWYDDNYFAGATTSPIISLQNATTYRLIAAGTATSSKLIGLDTPLRYLRANISITGAAGAVWAQIIPQKQSN